jgi:hypothetical protein
MPVFFNCPPPLTHPAAEAHHNSISNEQDKPYEITITNKGRWLREKLAVTDIK